MNADSVLPDLRAPRPEAPREDVPLRGGAGAGTPPGTARQRLSRASAR
ncbi:hypothetical protein [Streptomyces sp. NBC_01207]|nr:hypothetical protein OG457_42120 [Streptomyces sp. NBC_01207]WTA22957.1 hypothetical protein OG365_35775 [Streptomyces sp. NBC_00853]